MSRSGGMTTMPKRIADEEPTASEERLRLDTLAARLEVLEGQVRDIAGRAIEADVRELTHDLLAVITLLGHHLGQPFRSQAAEIVAKRQTGGEGSR